MARDSKFRTGRHGLIAALDVGTSKITCFIARQDAGRNGAPTQWRVLGIGYQVSEGVRSGAIVDMTAAEKAIRAAVDSAERMAEVTVEDVVLAFNTGAPTGERINTHVSIAGHEVGEADVRRVHQQGYAGAERLERDVIHTIPVTYTIDGSAGIREPRGMYGERLGVMMNVVTAAAAPLRNLIVCIERCHLRVVAPVVAPYASALSALVEDEMDLGVTCIDMGGGTTSFAVFRYGQLVACEVVPCGGHHVTKDIASGLTTTLAHAERMKTLHGSVLAGPGDDREMVSVPLIGEDDAGEPNRVPRATLMSIIRPRLEETFELVRERLVATGCESLAGRRVVLTGGASQMNGIRELAARVLERQVRLASPELLAGVPPATSGPAFSAVGGLLKFVNQSTAEQRRARLQPENGGIGRFARIGQWIKENF